MTSGRQTGRRRWIAALVAAFAFVGATAVAATAGANEKPPVTPAAANGHFSYDGKAPIPGRGLSIAWSPSGQGVAADGHFRDKATKQRYDTRTINVSTKSL